MEFCDLLNRHMRRIRASANAVASEIGMSREAVNNWRNGYSMPSPKHRSRVADCAAYLRLTESETNALLQAAGFEPEYAAAEGPAAAPPFVEQLFAQLASLTPYSIKLLLSQAGWGQPPCRETLLRLARQLYGESCVLHLQPPFSVDTSANDYFRLIGQQCGMEVNSEFAFEAGMASRLEQADRVFCLVSRFEQGDAQLRDQLAGILRSLSEMHAGRLHLLICGGPALADLKYRGGDLSLLNIADVTYWPEPGPAEVSSLASELGLALAPEAVSPELLLACGGHPGLIQEAIGLRDQGVADKDLPQHLANSERLWQAFTPLANNPSHHQSLKDALDADDVGPSRPYLVDPLRRQLFWQNLIATRDTPEGRRLVWRCEAVRAAGLAVCEQWADQG